MKNTSRVLAPAAVAALGLALAAPTAHATTAQQPARSSVTAAEPTAKGTPTRHGVFVQTDELAGNKIIAYRRGADGSLTFEHSYQTGGRGGALSGAVVDNVASQGAMTYDARRHILIAVNAGSNDVSVFAVKGASLRLLQVVASAGSFPVSVATSGSRAYVLNARDGGSVQGFRIAGRRLHPVASWGRELGLDTSVEPEFTHTPGQVGFTPDGRHLIVTTKAASHSIEIFGVARSGAVSAHPVVTTKDGSTPFGFTFTRAGHLAVTETGIGSVTTYAVRDDGTLAQLTSVPTTQAATCWVVLAGRYLYASNAGSASLTGFFADRAGALTLVGQSAADAGTVDAAASPDGRYVYAQGGAAGTVASFKVNTDGSLTRLASVTVPGAVGGEGIVAT